MNYLNSPITVLRGIARELRRTNSNMRPVSKTSVFSYLINEYRHHQVTERRTCKNPEELHLMAKTYLCYLQSLRQHEELLKEYYHKGERSVEETARLVGFSLPDSSEKEP